MITEQKFDELEHILCGINYQVFLRLYRNSTPAKSSMEAIQSIFPDAIIGKIMPATIDEVLFEVEQSICYVGDKSHGPLPGCLETDQGRKLSEKFMACVHELVSSTDRIESFGLKEGGLACPIYWGFSFLFTNTQGLVVLIGASED